MNQTDQEPHGEYSEDEPTIIIHERTVVDDADSDGGYTVRPRQSVDSEPADDPLHEEPVVAANVMFDDDDEDDVVVVLADDEPMGAGEGLLTAVPGEPGSEGFGVDPFEDDIAIPLEIVPEVEDVEDITTYLEDENLELDAPMEVLSYATEEQTQGSAGKLVAMLMTIAAMIVAAVYYGPELVAPYLPQPETTVAEANVDPDSDPVVDPVNSAEIAVTTEPSRVSDSPEVNVVPASVTPEFVDWMRGAMTKNFEMDFTQSETRNP